MRKQDRRVLQPNEAAILAKHLAIEGNKPNNLIILDKLSPSRLGALIALYEHKTFVQSAIWNITRLISGRLSSAKRLARDFTANESGSHPAFFRCCDHASH